MFFCRKKTHNSPLITHRSPLYSNVTERCRSALLSEVPPYMISYSPGRTRMVFVPVSKVSKASAGSSICTFCFSPARKATRLKALRLLMGPSVSARRRMYTCTTSSPSIFPLFFSGILRVSVLPAGSFLASALALP